MIISEGSLSKQWRDATKKGQFKGSFKDFAMLVNGENFYSDNADTNKLASTDEKETSKKVDLTKVEGVKILGMKPTTLAIVGGTALIITIAGIYLLGRTAHKQA